MAEQLQLFDQNGKILTSGIYDKNGSEIKLGDTVRVTYGPGKPFPTVRDYEVIWRSAGYQMKIKQSESPIARVFISEEKFDYFYLGNMAWPNVELEVVKI